MKKFISTFRPVVLTLAALCSLSGCGNGNNDDQTNLRFINAVADVDSVDLYVDADMWLEDVAYLDNSGYFNMDTEQHLFQVVPSNSLTPFDNLLTALQDDDDYTYIAVGSALDADALMLVDNNERPSSGSFKLRIIDAYQSSTSYNVYVITSAQQITSVAPTAKNLRYKSVTSYFTGRSGVYNVIITNSTTGDIVSTIANQTFNEEEVYTLILAANPSPLTPIYPLLLNDTEND
jgi:hypothetical protein